MVETSLKLLLELILEARSVLSKEGPDLIALGQLIIAFIALLVSIAGVGVGWYLVHVVQNGINNRRVLKDYFIREILEVRANYLDIIRNLQKHTARPKEIPHQFQQISIRINDLVPLLVKQFGVTVDLNSYHTALLECITDSDEYLKKFKRNTIIFSEPDSLEALQTAHQKEMTVFNALIIEVNNSK